MLSMCFKYFSIIFPSDKTLVFLLTKKNDITRIFAEIFVEIGFAGKDYQLLYMLCLKFAIKYLLKQHLPNFHQNSSLTVSTQMGLKLCINPLENNFIHIGAKLMSSKLNNWTRRIPRVDIKGNTINCHVNKIFHRELCSICYFEHIPRIN